MNSPNKTAKVAAKKQSLKVCDERLIELGRAVIETETRALEALVPRLDASFAAAGRCMLACQGRVVVLGMGKSGHIGGKIAATLASTGTPAFFVHPGEASHGDMGMITDKDVVMALSNSGETEEIVVLLPLIKRLSVSLIALTGNPRSTLAQAANVNLDVAVSDEACPLGLAPTASTTAALAMGDALAVALLELRGFSAEDFALAHPGGQLGRRLLLRLADVMHTGEQMPVVPPDGRLSDALMEMSKKGLGMTAVVAPSGRVAGIFTDGDLRRALDNDVDVRNTLIGDVMTRRHLSVSPALLATEALSLMRTNRINALLVVSPDQELLGVLNMHDLLRAGII